MASLYHVCPAWDGGSLRPLRDRINAGEISLADAYRSIALRYDWATSYPADRMDAQDWTDDAETSREWADYLANDAGQIHLHATLDDATAFAAELMADADILEIDADGLEIGVGTEYGQPVHNGLIPAARIRVLTHARD